jgi:hypothetical protein
MLNHGSQNDFEIFTSSTFLSVVKEKQKKGSDTSGYRVVHYLDTCHLQSTATWRSVFPY